MAGERHGRGIGTACCVNGPLCTYMLLLSAAITVLVLLVSSLVHFLAPAETQNVNVPYVGGYILTCISNSM